MAQQKLAQPVSRLQLILLGRLSSPHQIPQCFMRRVWDPHRRQFPGAVTARQLLRIAAVCFDPVPGLGGDQARRYHFTDNPQLRELPVEHIPRRTRLIASLDLLDRAQFVNQLANRLQPVRYYPMGARRP